MNKLNTARCLFIFCSFFLSSAVWAAEQCERCAQCCNKGGAGHAAHSIHVSGQAQQYAAPDKAELFLRVETLADTAKEAQDENSERMTAVQQALRAEGIDASNIKTQSYNLSQRTEWNAETKKSEFIGWQLEHAIKVTTTDLDSIGDVTQAAVDAGINRIDRVEFGLTDAASEAVRQEVLAMAAENAQQKATVLAETLGVFVGDVMTVREFNMVVQPYPAKAQLSTRAMEMDAAAAPPIEAGDVNISANISVAFAIE